MKALLICPVERPAVSALADAAPFSNLSIFGKELIIYWIEYLAGKGAREILVLAADRPEKVRALLGDGSRWGVKIQVIPEARELTVAEAKQKYEVNSPGWLNEPEDAILIDHLPGLEEKLFGSSAGFFSALQTFFPRAHTGNRIGLRQIMPGVWAGRRAQISPAARLIPPCWIGDHACVGSGAVVGPWVVLENRVLVDAGAEIDHSLVAAETFVGKLATVRNSLAIGSTLINWRTHSQIKRIDSFLLAPLNSASHLTQASWAGRLLAVAAMLATSPLAVAWISAMALQGQRVFQLRKALSPSTGQTIDYYEFAHTNGFWRRWPQLWSIARGDFSWVGNRPLNTMEAAELKTDFERLWLSAPIGLISHADALNCPEEFSDEARAHAAFYAARKNFKLDFTIFLSVLRQLCLPKKVPAAGASRRLLPAQNVPVPQPVSTASKLPRRVEGIAD